jgi:hypothetical protein
MDLNGMPVHHGLATMGGLGLIGVMPFGRFGRLELAAMKGKGRGEWRSPHKGRNRPAQHRGEAGGEEEQAAEVDLIIGRLGEWRGGARSGKMFWGKWPWPRAPFIAPGLLAEGAGRRDGGSR